MAPRKEVAALSTRPLSNGVTMTTTSRLFQAHFPALLPGVALAIALVALASPARSESIDLSCANAESQSSSIRLQVDTDRRTVLLDQDLHAATFTSSRWACRRATQKF
jgi:hypothetical protein